MAIMEIGIAKKIFPLYESLFKALVRLLDAKTAEINQRVTQGGNTNEKDYSPKYNSFHD